MNDKTKTVCFSGHRVLYDSKDEIENRLEKAIRQCITNGAENFMAGGALGFDTLAARTVLRLKKEYPKIRLVLALPCPPSEQTLRWTNQQKGEYQEILEQADEVITLSPKYVNGCMLERNRYMVNNSVKLIHYLRSDRGGTKYTVKYAKTRGIELIEL